MTTRSVTNEFQREALVKLIQAQSLPFTCEVVKGKRRSVNQNRTQRMWMKEVSEQLQDRTPEEVRGYCKLHFGVPMLREENELFREKYDRIVKPLPYETKLELMMEPLDFPVTRLMTTHQHARYLDAIWTNFIGQGVVLTDPERIAA